MIHSFFYLLHLILRCCYFIVQTPLLNTVLKCLLYLLFTFMLRFVFIFLWSGASISVAVVPPLRHTVHCFSIKLMHVFWVNISRGSSFFSRCCCFLHQFVLLFLHHRHGHILGLKSIKQVPEYGRRNGMSQLNTK